MIRPTEHLGLTRMKTVHQASLSRKEAFGPLDHEREFGLRLQSYASDGAKTPVQSVAISRPDDSMTVDPSSDYYW